MGKQPSDPYPCSFNADLHFDLDVILTYLF